MKRSRRKAIIRLRLKLKLEQRTGLTAERVRELLAPKTFTQEQIKTLYKVPASLLSTE